MREPQSAPGPIGRLAPSPTGRLHLGHARSFLLAWWSARAAGGRIRLRLEDLDTSRVRAGYVAGCLQDLEWLGLDWDGPPLVQSEGLAGLEAALAELVSRGLAYPCICTRSEIEGARSAPHGDDGSGAYPGTCRGRFADLAEAERVSGRRAALRLRVPDVELQLEDRVVGPFRSRPALEVGDFPLTSRDGQIAYQLAVVVDDARQGVNEVLRGDDLLSSTGRQALLQDLLALPHPTWAHVPLVTDAAGRRLAKRADDLSLAHLRSLGVAPEAVVAWAARSAGLEVPARVRAEEVLAAFDLALLPRSPVVCPTPEALLAPPRFP
jgi:glutamyl-tRNA synthetase